MGDDPRAAEPLAVNVNVLLPLVLAGLKDAVTPEGKPEAASATVPVKLFCGVMVIVLVLEPACARLTLAGAADKMNVGGPVMVSDRRAVLVRLPDVPVIVGVDVAAAAELAAVSVSMLVVSALAGLNDAVTPAGNPEIVRFTALLKPCCVLMVMVLVPLAPAAIERVDADEARLNVAEPDVPAKLLMKDWPAGLPQPVARS